MKKNLEFIGYGNYSVTDCGIVISENKGTDRKLRILKNGYYDVGLWKNSKVKKFLVHRLVGLAFIPNPNKLPQINHIDGDKLNNNVSNLEWVTGSENHQHAHTTGLATTTYGVDIVREACILLQYGLTSYEVADKLNTSTGFIHSIVSGRSWSFISKDYDLSKVPMRTCLPIEDVNNICQMIQDGVTKNDIVRETGYSRTLVRNISTGRTNKTISDKYDFTNQVTKTDISDEKVHIICKMLSDGKLTKDIVKTVGCGANTVGRIKRKQTHTNISDKYNFKVARKQSRITKDVIHNVCEMLSNGETIKTISESVSCSYSNIGLIRVRKLHTDISKDYVW